MAGMALADPALGDPRVDHYLPKKGRSRLGDTCSPEFWAEFMKRPDAQAAYAAQRRLEEKKRLWLEERRKIEERGAQRKKVADALEDAPVDIKKLIAPIFHIRLVEAYLWQVYEECGQPQRSNATAALLDTAEEKKRRAFVERLRTDERVKSEVTNYRLNFHEGGEGRMEDMEKQIMALNREMELQEEKKREIKPQAIDVHTLKELLEYAQECKYLGNEKYAEGLYEEALQIYAQADEAMKKWKVDSKLRNESKWLTDSHLACLKNKSAAALNLELFQTALEAADQALKLDDEDHKAWFRKVQALKGLGKFEDADTALTKLEDVAQWCPDRRRILRDCEVERKKIKVAKAKHKEGTKVMLGKALESGIFSNDRERELEDATKNLELPAPRVAKPRLEAPKQPERPKAVEDERPVDRKIQLTAALAGDLMDELASAYSQKPFQEKVRKCARDSGFERTVFLMRLKDVAFAVQKPVLEKWGFEGSEQGVREMTAAIRDHAVNGTDMPDWLKKKQDRCLQLLYGGKEGGMLDILTKAP